MPTDLLRTAAKTRANEDLTQHGPGKLAVRTAPLETLSVHMASSTHVQTHVLIEISNLLSNDTCRFADWD